MQVWINLATIWRRLNVLENPHEWNWTIWMSHHHSYRHFWGNFLKIRFNFLHSLWRRKIINCRLTFAFLVREVMRKRFLSTLSTHLNLVNYWAPNLQQLSDSWMIFEQIISNKSQRHIAWWFDTQSMLVQGHEHVCRN